MVSEADSQFSESLGDVDREWALSGLLSWGLTREGIEV
jgi:hypothetical protein